MRFSTILPIAAMALPAFAQQPSTAASASSSLIATPIGLSSTSGSTTSSGSASGSSIPVISGSMTIGTINPNRTSAIIVTNGTVLPTGRHGNGTMTRTNTHTRGGVTLSTGTGTRTRGPGATSSGANASGSSSSSSGIAAPTMGGNILISGVVGAAAWGVAALL